MELRLSGREIGNGDLAEAPRVAVVNLAFTRRFYPREDPLGRQLRIAGTTQAFTIVGVAGNAKYHAIRETPTPLVYLPYAQLPALLSSVPLGISFEVRADRADSPVPRVIRSAVEHLEPGLATTDFRSEDSQIDDSIAQQRLLTRFAVLFGLSALFMASLGLYGVINRDVSSRSRELGIRLALGAQPRSVRLMVLRQTLSIASVGFIIGVLAALAAGWLVTSQLYGVKPGDPLIIVIVGTTLLAVAGLAGYWPARRASLVDPAANLRQE